MTAHSAAAESYRGIGVDDDFLDYVFNNSSSTSSIIISRVADDDEGFLCDNVKNTNMIVITPTSQVKPTIVDVVATTGAASTVTKAQSHQAIIDELHLTSSRPPPPPPHNDNASTPKRCNITKKKHVIEQFFSSTFSLTDSSSNDDSHKSHLDDDGDDSYKSHLHDDGDDNDDDESIVNDNSIGDVSITWSFSDIQSDGDNGSNSNNNNDSNYVINVNYKYDEDDEDTTSIGGVVTIEDIILGNAAFDKENTVQDDDAAIVADKNRLFDQLYDADDDDDDNTSKWSLSAVGGINDDRDEFIESVRVRLGMVEI